MAHGRKWGWPMAMGPRAKARRLAT
ncbi:hypothetical protein CCACVL1_20767 [Corchorus capsularis]|uniref:Uncharacterized protein n=1 Tax=Corchorus capsularis TaxID=210143 RepID=A0A1R3HA78_COCAP|nr:hypothetical protein CCACVL1_20767 [Corchorus capsularis]